MTGRNRRFIAGARCPGCGEVDKIYVIRESGRTSRHCTRCDFEEVQQEDRPEWSPVRLTGSENDKKTQQ